VSKSYFSSQKMKKIVKKKTLVRPLIFKALSYGTKFLNLNHNHHLMLTNKIIKIKMYLLAKGSIPNV
jgi:hypothetical protein